MDLFIIASVLIFLGVFGFLLKTAIVFIPNDRVGIVEKLFSLKGSVSSGLIALDGEAGYQPNVLRGGWHFFIPFQYKIHTYPLVNIPQGRIGYVIARDGKPLPSSQTLGSNKTANNFEDARGFLANGGQRGPQRQILREGTYAINLALFTVFSGESTYSHKLDAKEADSNVRTVQLINDRGGFIPKVVKDDSDKVAVVVVHDGQPLPSGEIIAPLPPNGTHSDFQDPDAFIDAGGYRGRQLQVLMEGTYYLNALFATVETHDKYVINVGEVGVVISYTGDDGDDVSGEDFKHGEIVETGSKGVLKDPLKPGKYALNPYAVQVKKVPTINVVLKWVSEEGGDHRLDENLTEISLITQDAFELVLPLSVVIHIDYHKAPQVIQRFGDIKQLIEQTIDPMVASYFKNTAQTKTVLELIHDRAEIQKIAMEDMKARFAHYNLELEEVMIGTPRSSGTGNEVENLLLQLRNRKLAEQQIQTYQSQQEASVKERELREVEAKARQQDALTASEVNIEIESNKGKAEVAKAKQEADRITTLATAKSKEVELQAKGEAEKIRLTGKAESENIVKIGLAQAIATQEQVAAYGGPTFKLAEQIADRIARALETSGVDIVPKITIGQQSNGVTGSLQSLVDVISSDKLQELLKTLESSDKGNEYSEVLTSMKKNALAELQTSLDTSDSEVE